MDTVDINHRLHGGYVSWFGSFADVFMEYVDKQSKLRTYYTDFSGWRLESFSIKKRFCSIH